MGGVVMGRNVPTQRWWRKWAKQQTYLQRRRSRSTVKPTPQCRNTAIVCRTPAPLMHAFSFFFLRNCQSVDQPRAKPKSRITLHGWLYSTVVYEGSPAREVLNRMSFHVHVWNMEHVSK